MAWSISHRMSTTWTAQKIRAEYGCSDIRIMTPG
jgi:hypothetical protein